MSIDDEILACESELVQAQLTGDVALLTRMEPLDRKLLHLGATSVVSVRMNAEAVVDRVPVAATLRCTRVWHKRLEGWRLVAGHMSTAP